MKKIFLAIMMLSLLLTGCSNNSKEKEDTKQEGVEVDGSIISWANMKVDNSDLKLTDQQKEVLKYFDKDYLKIDNYENLKRYPNVFKGAQLNFYGHIKSDIKSNDETYQLLFNINSTSIDYDNAPENYVVIEGKQKEPRFVEGDNLLIYGRYKEIKEYEINGKKYSLPTISVNKFEEITSTYNLEGTENYDDVINFYSQDAIQKVSSAIFGEGTRTTFVNDEKIFNYKFSDAPYQAYCSIEPGKQLNGNPKFLIDLYRSNILFSDSTADYTKELYVMANFKDFLGISYEVTTKKLYFDYYDENFNKKWSKEFANANNYTLDYTNEVMYLVVNNDLHIINLSDGKEAGNTTTVGEKTKVNITKDGAFLIGKGQNDNISKINSKGEIVWKVSVDSDVEKCNMLQVIDNHIIVSLATKEKAKKIVSISLDGKILQEFWNEGVS